MMPKQIRVPTNVAETLRSLPDVERVNVLAHLQMLQKGDAGRANVVGPIKGSPHTWYAMRAGKVVILYRYLTPEEEKNQGREGQTILVGAVVPMSERDSLGHTLGDIWKT
jgi:mRNA-degrading endonuclease RelE of RelBE toxin-antitoxin system